MTVGELIKRQKDLIDLYARLEEQRDLTIDGGVIKIDRDDLIDCIECVDDCIRFINKTHVDF